MRRMVGRDPGEPHRAASSLELLYDLTLVVTFSQAGTQMAHLLEIGHFAAALGAFAFATFGICWAWINYSWLASAFDNDDVFFRIATMVQMMGVLVMALGLPALFHSIDEGVHVDNEVMVAGYVVMRLSTIALWLRAARHNPGLRRTAYTYATLIAIAQAVWTVLIVIDPPIGVMIALTATVAAFEMTIPVIAERLQGGTPWHPHHIAERYGLLIIITIGEVVLGTILAISAVVEEQGWSSEAGLIAFGGTALAFALWWVYFTMPSGEVLARYRERGFVWGYGHMLLFAAIAATGSGLHVAAFVIDGTAKIGTVTAMLTVTIPVGVFTTALFVLYSLLLHQVDALHLVLFLGAALTLAAAVAAVAAGASLGTGIVITALSPIVIIVGYETVGHRHQDEAIARIVTAS